MRILVPAIISAAMGMSLVAQTTGTLAGKVLDSTGKPVAGVKFTASKLGINWVKEIPVGKDGKYVQVGFSPGDYDLTISAPGYAEQRIQALHLGVGLVTQRDFVLLTPEEAAKAGGSGAAGVPVVDPSALAENTGLKTFNQAVVAFNEKRFTDALPLFETALSSMKESLEKSADETAKAETLKKVATMERPAAITMIEVGKVTPERKAELFAKAEPMLLHALERDPKDQASLMFLVELAKAKNDVEGEKKYQATLDALIGPRPELAYNQGVELYNAGKLAEAKPFFQKAITIKVEYAEAYYLLAMCEFAEMNLKGTKVNLQKYLELSPTGKHAGEVKEMLKAPELKNVK